MSDNTYGKWIDWECVICGQDWDYYRDQAQDLIRITNEVVVMLAQTMEGRDQLSRVKIPKFPHLKLIDRITHRQHIERLWGMIDVICQIEALAGCPEDGYYIEQRRDGLIWFIPPSQQAWRRLWA